MNITIQITKGQLPTVIQEIYTHGCEIHKTILHDTLDGWDTYSLEVSYSNSELYNNLLAKLNSLGGGIKIVEIKNILEDTIIGGLLRMVFKLPIESHADYEMNLLGAGALITEMASRENAMQYSGISRAIALIHGAPRKDATPTAAYIRRHVMLEKDSALIQRFVGLNGYPILIEYNHIEDFFKTLQGIQSGFSAMRIQDIDGMEDGTAFEQLYDAANMPILTHAYDELPLSILSELMHLLKKNRVDNDTTNIGIIGINATALRLTRLLVTMGFSRILGCDNNEKLMLVFEKTHGMATTPDNIFNNADILFIFKNHYTIDEFYKIRAGQMLFSLIEEEDELETSVILEKGVKEYIPCSHIESMVFFPGLLKGMLHTGVRRITDSMLIGLAEKMTTIRSSRTGELTLFGNLHERVAEFTRTIQME